MYIMVWLMILDIFKNKKFEKDETPTSFVVLSFFKISYIIHFLKMWKRAIQEVKSNVRWVSKIM